MNFFAYLRIRIALWRLQWRIDGLAESAHYHERAGHLCLGRAWQDRRKMHEARAELERMSTALANGVPT